MTHLDALLSFARIRGASVEQRTDLIKWVQETSNSVGTSIEETARWLLAELYPEGETVRQQAVLKAMPLETRQEPA